MFTYNHKEKTVTEVATMPYPTCEDDVDENLDGTFRERLIWYNLYLSELRTYPAIGFSQEDEGRELEEGKDFEIKKMGSENYDHKFIPSHDVAIRTGPEEGNEAIEFMKWKEDNFIEWNNRDKYYWKVAGAPLGVKPKSVEQLYQLFKTKV